MAKKRKSSSRFKSYKSFDLDWIEYIACESFRFLNGRINTVIPATELEIIGSYPKLKSTLFHNAMTSTIANTLGTRITFFPDRINEVNKARIYAGISPFTPVDVMNVIFHVIAHELSHIDQNTSFSMMDPMGGDDNTEEQMKSEIANDLNTLKWINDHLTECSRYMGFPVWSTIYECISSYLNQNNDREVPYTIEDYHKWDSVQDALKDMLNGLFAITDVEGLIKYAIDEGVSIIALVHGTLKGDDGAIVPICAPGNLLRHEGHAFGLYEALTNLMVDEYYITHTGIDYPRGKEPMLYFCVTSTGKKLPRAHDRSRTTYKYNIILEKSLAETKFIDFINDKRVQLV